MAEAIREAAESATDFSWLSEGDTVLIKPVVNSGNPYPATTNPTAVRAVAALLKEKGADRVIVSDTSGIENVRFFRNRLTGSSRELMTRCGIAQAAEAGGAELFFPEEQGWEAFFEDSPASGSHWKASVMMPKIVREVDHIVLMPRCGRHILAGSTLGLKAAVGYWRTDTRLEYHHDAATFHEKTAEGNTVSSLRERQRLVLTTATQTLATFGPDKGYMTEPETGLIIASEDIVAHDMVSLAWLLENQALAPESERSASRDPYKSQFVVNLANRVVTRWLGGMGSALTAQRLIRKDIDTIWDDRALNRAYRLWGGIPQVTISPANEMVPTETRQKISGMVSLPAATV
ncbi:DUF362 domain-containing protein [Candidatus Poribacteria bacterium]|nr:DUF362 domain-containing protein [Candidatus Poribacteria bacterium]